MSPLLSFSPSPPVCGLRSKHRWTKRATAIWGSPSSLRHVLYAALPAADSRGGPQPWDGGWGWQDGGRAGGRVREFRKGWQRGEDGVQVGAGRGADRVNLRRERELLRELFWLGRAREPQPPRCMQITRITMQTCSLILSPQLGWFSSRSRGGKTAVHPSPRLALAPSRGIQGRQTVASGEGLPSRASVCPSVNRDVNADP